MDNIANIINGIKNASVAGHATTVFPYSKLSLAILECLEKQGYVKNVAKKTRKTFPVIEVGIVYTQTGAPKLATAERVSRSSARVYVGVKDLGRVRSTRGGIVVLSTPKGIMTDKEARKEMVGGEVLFKLA